MSNLAPQFRGEARPWCTFRVDEDLYGLDVLLIREVALLPPITPVPHAPPAVLGCVNLRGQIHLALDLRHLLGRGRTVPGPSARLILFKSELGDPFGVLVEQIADIVRVPADSVENRVGLEVLDSGAVNPAEETLVLGVARLREQLLLLLDARRLLASLHRLAQEEEVGS
jgi:purine-binding chemotaxis protein CheW